MGGLSLAEFAPLDIKTATGYAGVLSALEVSSMAANSLRRFLVLALHFLQSFVV
jgi:hypothetical protein